MSGLLPCWKCRLLIRRKRLKFEEVQAEAGQEILKLRSVRTGNLLEVINPRLSEDEMMAVQDEVFKVLGWE